MLKLMRADFARLIKTRSYWICVILSSALCLTNAIFDHIAKKEAVDIGGLLTGDTSNIMLFAAIFASLYIGTDHSCGTIRNKIIVGSGRGSIYLSNLVVISTAALGIRVITWLLYAVFGLAVGGRVNTPAGELAVLMTVSALAIVAACSVFTLIGMLISSKSGGVVASIVSAIAIIIGGAMILELLNQPEMLSDYILTENGIEVTEPVPNPLYVKGALRDILTAVNDILPGGQAIQLKTHTPHDPELMPLYSLGVTAVVTAAGLTLFRRKDLK